MSVPPRLAWLPALLLAVASCGPLDLTGKLCSAERPCPSGWECYSGACRKAGTGNQLQNGGFESAVNGWTASHATLATTTPGRSSASAAQWNPDGTADSVMTLITPGVDASKDGYWCATAWVKTTGTADVTLTLLGDGQSQAESAEAITSGVWTRLEARALVLFSKTLSVSLTSALGAGARQIQVDDVALWKSDSCAVAP